MVPASGHTENKVVNVTLTGGLIGYWGSSPKRRLQRALTRHNEQGWRFVHVIPAESGNFLLALLRALISLVTLGIYVPMNGFYLFLERAPEHAPAEPVCPGCGGKVDAADAFCLHCGQKLK